MHTNTCTIERFKFMPPIHFPGIYNIYWKTLKAK